MSTSQLSSSALLAPAALSLVLVASACAPEDTETEATPTETTQATQAAVEETEPSDDEEDASSSDAQDEESSTDEDEDAEGEQSPEGSITVESEGDGPIALTTADAVEDATEVEGRLITGPGNCFALNRQDQPELLVFPENAEFVFQGDRPSVTTDENGTMEVGNRTSLNATEMDISDVDGIPDRCSQGANNTVLVVNG